MDMLAITYDANLYGAEIKNRIRENAERLGFRVQEFYEKERTKRKAHQWVYLVEYGASPERFAIFASELSALGLSGFDEEKPYLHGCGLTILAATGAEIDGALSVFRAYGFTDHAMDAKYTDGH